MRAGYGDEADGRVQHSANQWPGQASATRATWGWPESSSPATPLPNLEASPSRATACERPAEMVGDEGVIEGRDNQ